jgi:hypothetical protein
VFEKAWRFLKAYDIEEVKRRLMDSGSSEEYLDRNIADAQPGMDRKLPRPYGLMSHQALNRLIHGWFEHDIRDMLDNPNFSFERDDEGKAIWSAHNLGWGNPEHADPEHMGFMIENQLEGTPVDFEEIRREINLRKLENTPWEINEPQQSSFLGMKLNPSSTTDFSSAWAYGPTDTLEQVEGMRGRGFQDIHTGEPMDLTWRLLKATRQTELGEFHPDFPSSYGPVTMIRYHPTQNWYDNFDAHRANYGDTFDETIPQSPQSLITEGLKATPASEEAHTWEALSTELDQNKENYRKFKRFDLSGKGTWFHPAGMNRHSVFQSSATGRTPTRTAIGVRMPLKDVQGQFRNWTDEGPEAWVQQDIPPERLVRVPIHWRAQRPTTWGKRGK